MKDTECEVLFDQTPDISANTRTGISLYRTKTTKAGDVLYVECFPIWSTRAMEYRAVNAYREHVSQEAIRRINHRNAAKKLEQLVNANFRDGDIWMGLTYRDDQQPADRKQSQRDMQNFVKRVKRMHDKLGIQSELKYIYVTERTESKKRGTRYHHHMILSGTGLDRDALEKLWQKGFVNSRRCQTMDGTLSALAQYMAKQTRDKNERAWNASKNLTKPRVTVADHKLSPRKIEKIAQNIRENGKAILEAAYPGARLVEDVTVHVSPWVSGAYIYAKLVRRDAHEDAGADGIGRAKKPVRLGADAAGASSGA